MLVRTIRVFYLPTALTKGSTRLTAPLFTKSFCTAEPKSGRKPRSRPKQQTKQEEIRTEAPRPTAEKPRQEKTAPQETGEGYIPQNFAMKHLVWPATNSSVLLLGVDRRDGLHGSFLQDILSKSNAELISIQVSPDEPYFVRTDSNYKLAWKKFIAGNFDQRFLVSPNPQFLADIIIDSEKQKMFIEGSVMRTPEVFEVGSTFIYSKAGKIQTSQKVDCFLSPLLFTYNNPDRRINVVVNDVPLLTQRDFLTRVLSTKRLRELLDKYIDALASSEEFDPQVVEPEAFINPRIAYITETIRQSCYVNKRIISIVDYNFMDLIEEEWKNLGKEMRNLTTCLVPNLPPKYDLSYTEYLERHVLLDLLFEPFVKDNFVDLKSFPFSGKNTAGVEIAKPNVFLIWDHHYNKHADKINKRPASFEEMASTTNVEFEMDSLMQDPLAEGANSKNSKNKKK